LDELEAFGVPYGVVGVAAEAVVVVDNDAVRHSDASEGLVELKKVNGE
jgi:hypothetical protein